MSGSRASNESLRRKVVRQVCLFAAVAMIAQFALTIGRYASDVDHMSDHLLDMEIGALAAGLTVENGKPVYTLPRSLRARYGGGDTGYIARIRTRAGVVLFESCDAVCMAARLPQETPDTLSWLRRSRDGYPISVAGGRTFELAGQSVLVDIAIEQDPAGRVWSVFGEELVEEMLLPTAITLGFALVASLFAIRRSLAPVKAAAAKAEALDPAGPYARVETDGMPLEIAQFAGAMDRGYRKVRELMEAQKVFTAAISHEVRTPLAIVRLELEAIDHERARAAIKEIDDLVAFVEQLTALARIEAAERPSLVPTDLDGVLRDAVAAMAPWVYDRGGTIALADSDPGGQLVLGDATLLRSAVRNLIENAVEHGGAGVSVEVRSGEGPSIVVSDNGDGALRDDEASFLNTRRDGRLGLGLQIVRRIASLHGARLTVSQDRPGGVRATLTFNPSSEPSATAKRKPHAV